MYVVCNLDIYPPPFPTQPTSPRLPHIPSPNPQHWLGPLELYWPMTGMLHAYRDCSIPLILWGHEDMSRHIMYVLVYACLGVCMDTMLCTCTMDVLLRCVLCMLCVAFHPSTNTHTQHTQDHITPPPNTHRLTSSPLTPAPLHFPTCGASCWTPLVAAVAPFMREEMYYYVAT